jgi:4-hydroxybenzoate polyprenyltransferase
LVVARLFHLAALAGFGAFAVMAGGGWLRLAAVVAAALLLAWQHRLIATKGLVAVDAAFFTANGALAVVMCVFFLFAKMLPAL